jgi:hypothetical protein
MFELTSKSFSPSTLKFPLFSLTGLNKIKSMNLVNPFNLLYHLPFKIDLNGWRTFSKCQVELSYHTILGPFFWESPTLGLHPSNIPRQRL